VANDKLLLAPIVNRVEPARASGQLNSKESRKKS